MDSSLFFFKLHGCGSVIMNKRNFNTIWLILIGICLIAALVAVVACILPSHGSAASSAACGLGSVLCGSPYSASSVITSLF